MASDVPEPSAGEPLQESLSRPLASRLLSHVSMLLAFIGIAVLTLGWATLSGYGVLRLLFY